MVQKLQEYFLAMTLQPQGHPKVKEKPGAATEADPGQSYLVSVSSFAIFSSMAALMYAVTERP